jgi:molybdopterin-guanine dinucleotide biosynthesis protein A
LAACLRVLILELIWYQFEYQGAEALVTVRARHQKPSVDFFNESGSTVQAAGPTTYNPASVMKRYPQAAAFILAGGVSSRMGREKGLMEFGGEALIVRTARLIEPLVSEVTVIGPPERYDVLGLRVIADQTFARREAKEAVQTPLVGIATALRIAATPWNLILACDLPYLNANWLDWLLARALDSRAEIVMPRTSAGLEPLAAIYGKECAPTIVAALERGVRKVTEAMAEFRMECVSESDWSGHDPGGRVLRNMNTPSDYEEARKWLEKK